MKDSYQVFRGTQCTRDISQLLDTVVSTNLGNNRKKVRGRFGLQGEIAKAKNLIQIRIKSKLSEIQGEIGLK